MALSLLLWLVALAVAGAFAMKRWWLPQAINAHAASFDSWFAINFWIAGIIFFAAQAALGWIVFRYRQHNVGYSEGDRRLEIVWTSFTAVLFLAAAGIGARMFAALQFAPVRAGALRIEVSAQQFSWNFRYAGPDGRFGQTDIRFVNDAAGNPFGIDENDAAGRDDIVSSALRVPAGRPVELILRSRDVIHNLFVRELRMKQDLVPGMEIPLRFAADVPGEYEIACAELCGLGHHQMRSVLIVLPPQDFDAWLASQAAGR
jgi:cytochrome c oxidase subunit 2